MRQTDETWLWVYQGWIFSCISAPKWYDNKFVFVDYLFWKHPIPAKINWEHTSSNTKKNAHTYLLVYDCAEPLPLPVGTIHTMSIHQAQLGKVWIKILSRSEHENTQLGGGSIYRFVMSQTLLPYLLWYRQEFSKLLWERVNFLALFRVFYYLLCLEATR